MFTSQATIERRAAKEKRLGGIEERLSALENAAAVDLTPIETRLATLENKPAPVADIGPIESRLAALEAAKPVDLSDIEARLVILEATLKALAARSDDHSDMLHRLESAEANAALVRKELDELKAASAKKTVGGGFGTGSSSFGTAATAPVKNFAFPAKKKEESVATE